MENNQEIVWGSYEENESSQDNNENWDTWSIPSETNTPSPNSEDSNITWGTLETDQPLNSQSSEILENNNQNLNLEELSNINQKFSYLGNFNKIEIKNSLYQLNIDNTQAIKDLQNSNIKKLDDDYRFEFNPISGTALGDVIGTVVNIAKKNNSKITNCFLYQVPSGGSVLNLYRGKPSKAFIYFLQADYDSGDVILDFSSLGGPSIKTQDSTTGILSLIPGWVPYKITQNKSKFPLIFIAGTLT